jgi:hypothetical protein
MAAQRAAEPERRDGRENEECERMESLIEGGNVEP